MGDEVKGQGSVHGRAGSQTHICLGSKTVFCFEANIVLSGLQLSSGLWKK